MKIAIGFLSLIVLAVSAFAQEERQILVIPRAEHPQAAKVSGLGGRVTVYVTVDPEGNIVSVVDVNGPDSVCPSVTREDVVALRESAKAAALNAKFAAGSAGLSTTIPLNFDFPSIGGGTRSGSFTVRGDRNYSASPSEPATSAKDTPPPDYTGPAVAAGAAPRIPSQISGGVLNGKAVSLPKPPYPPAARAVRASGAVTIQVLIEEEGKVFSAAAVSGHPLLRSAARLAACGAEFTPTLLMGNPVKVSGVITYNFIP